MRNCINAEEGYCFDNRNNYCKVLITVATELYCETLIDMILVHIMLICTIISCRPVGDQ